MPIGDRPRVGLLNVIVEVLGPQRLERAEVAELDPPDLPSGRGAPPRSA